MYTMQTSNDLEVSVTSGVEQVGYDYFAFFTKEISNGLFCIEGHTRLAYVIDKCE
jgi:hypothetical protein